MAVKHVCSCFLLNIFFSSHRVNQIVRDKSNATAVTFMYLPAPPKVGTIDYKERCHHYLDLLTELTYDLPPTILVHGINAVTSTTL